MILSHRHKLIYFCNGKTASTSVEAALRPYQEGPEYDIAVTGLFAKGHVPPALLKACLPEKIWREYYKVVFVRNPWDWFVSCWYYNSAWLPPPWVTRRRGVRGKVKGAVTATARRLVNKTPPSLMCTPENADHLFRLLRFYRGLPGAKTCTQTVYAYDADGNPLVDFVGRFENLEADFKSVCRRVGLDAALPHLNRTEHLDYRKCFTPEGRERVAELWAADVRNFGYSF